MADERLSKLQKLILKELLKNKILHEKNEKGELSEKEEQIFEDYYRIHRGGNVYARFLKYYIAGKYYGEDDEEPRLTKVSVSLSRSLRNLQEKKLVKLNCEKTIKTIRLTKRGEFMGKKYLNK